MKKQKHIESHSPAGHLKDEVLAYLKKEQLTESLSLTENDRISFHWADWEETCRFQKSFIFNNSFSCERYFQLTEELENLKNRPIRLKNRFKTIQSTEHDLYSCYSDSRIRATWFDREHEILMSYENESGPYTSQFYEMDGQRYLFKICLSEIIGKVYAHEKIPTESEYSRENEP